MENLDLSKMLDLIGDMPGYQRLVGGLGRGEGSVRLSALDAAKPYLVAAVYRELQRPVMVVTAQPENARRLYDQLLSWCGSGEVRLFPEPDTLPYERLVSDSPTEQERIEVLYGLVAGGSDDRPQAAPPLVLPIMVVNLLGPEQNAYFYIAWTIGSLLFAIPHAVSRSLFAEGAHFEDELGANVYRSFRFSFLILIPAIVLLLLLGEWLLLLFGVSYSANGLLLLKSLVLSSPLICINTIYFSILRVQDRIMELVIISGFTTIGTLVGSYFIVPMIGITGSGYALLTTQGIIGIYVVFALIKSYRHKGPAKTS